MRDKFRQADSAVPYNTADDEEGVEHGEAVLEGGEEHGDVRHQDHQLDQDHQLLHVGHLVRVLPLGRGKKFHSVKLFNSTDHRACYMSVIVSLSLCHL